MVLTIFSWQPEQIIGWEDTKNDLWYRMTQSMILVGKMFELLTYYTGVRDRLIHKKPSVSRTCVALISCGQGRVRNFCLGMRSCSIDIFIKIIPPHVYIHTLFLLYKYTIFYLISYIYTHPKKKKKELNIFNQNYI